MKLHVYAEKFRAHSKAALAGGAGLVTSKATLPSHTHDVSIGTKTSVSGGRHSHSVSGVTSGASGSHRHEILHYMDDVPTPATERRYEGYFEGAVMAEVDIESGANRNMETYEQAADHSHTVSGQTAEAAGSHTHDVNVGVVTSESGGGSHTHDVDIPDHTHDIDYGIYEEDVAGRTLSAKLYDPDGNLVHDFGVITTGEDDETIDLSSYFSNLKYGMYKLTLEASGRIRVRLVFYELCVMYAI